MKICKIENCNNSVWSNNLCKNHTPKTRLLKSKKALASSRKLSSSVNKKTSSSDMHQFFLHIWKTRPHVSELSDVWLGKEPSSAFFHHILPKSKYPEASLDEENIILLTIEEHDQVEMDMYRYPRINDIRNYLLKKYERA